MSLKTGQVVALDFTTNSATGELVNADVLPTATLVVAGVDLATVVTVTNKAAGKYKATVTLPGIAAGSIAQIRVDATIGGVASGGIIFTSLVDTVRTSDVPTAIQVATALMAYTVDTVAVSKILQAVLSTLCGVTEVAGNTIRFKAVDGLTTVVTVTVEEGERTSSVVS